MGILLSFFAGISAGSFMNLCIYRIPRGEGILKGLFRFYKRPVSHGYPLVELASGILWLLLFIKYGTGIEFFKYAIFVSILIVVGIIDFDTGEVYTSIIVFGVMAGLVTMLVMQCWWPDYVYGAIAGFAFIAPIAMLGGMGWGDAEVCLLCGLFLGLKSIFIMLLISFVLGGAAGIMLIALGKSDSGSRMPFVPFITLASILTLFLGNQIACFFRLAMIV
ncbi:MAG: A24 family peptidase [Clostridiaceae bacterium]